MQNYIYRVKNYKLDRFFVMKKIYLDFTAVVYRLILYYSITSRTSISSIEDIINIYKIKKILSPDTQK